MHEFAKILLVCMAAAPAAFAQNTFPANGNVGIGTTGPFTPLQVHLGTNENLTISDNGSGISRISSVNDEGNGNADLQFQAANYHFYNGGASSQVLTILNSGNVGIGTAAPAAKLDLGDTSGNGALETVLARLYEGGGTGDGTYLGVRGWATQPTGALSFSIEHHFYGQANSSINFYRGGSTGGGFITFATYTNLERMRIDPSGNVGIGTTSPAYRLDVSGQVRASGGVVFPDGTTQTTAFNPQICSGGDYAESVNVTGSPSGYEPGDVLVLAPEGAKDVVKSTEPYSTVVAGIYSTKPGYVGRRQQSPKSADEIPMAMIGIVPTKVSAENGPIQRGDLLVTSSTPGYAMKGTDRSRMLGAVVGKAMGSLESGTGMIEVLVTLQ